MSEQRCCLCGGGLSPRWEPTDPLLCRNCGAGNRRLQVLEDRGAELAHDYYVEESVALDPETALD